MVKRFPGYCTGFWFDETIQWMRQRHQKRQPFFCYLTTNTPHGPAWVDWRPFSTRPGGAKTQLHGWFQDAAGQDLCGAYYASVRRL